MHLAARSTSDLGLVSYDEGLRIQREHVERRINGEIGDTLLLCEHPPVYTLGSNASPGHVLDTTRAEVIQSDRGGEVTWHGPGQVVGYVICAMLERGKDLHGFCRDLEEIMIRALADFCVAGERVDKITGVFVGRDKIGALGVRVRRWVTMHGFALNVNPDLSYFDGIIPCGITDRKVTSMQQALGRPADIEKVKESCAHHFQEVFEV